MYTELTPMQKLHALGFRFYQGDTQNNGWKVKAGDYYTTSRPDLELYRVVSVAGGKVTTQYCANPAVTTEWDEYNFLTEGFGPNRVRVPEWIFQEC